ncbi:MAG: dephospho-CoA kinase [Gammaproteobacteria bacterium]
MPNKSLLKIGLTGGLASGKTTVANYFSELGITIIDTDQIAREVVQPDTAAYQQIVKRFGNKIVKSDGSLDRSQLRTIIFNKSKERHWLENLLHPLIREEAQRRLPLVTSPYCILVIPLLVETSPNPLVDRILVVDTPEYLQIARAQQRDHMNIEQILLILRAQANRQQRLAMADDIIYNDNDLKRVKQQVAELHLCYSQLSSSRSSS